MSSPRPETKPAIDVKCGALSPERVMKVMCSRQARSIPRLLTMPWLYPKGEQHDFEQHGRRVGGGAGQVVLVAAIEARQVEFVVDQMVECVFEAAGQQLPFKIDGEKARAGVDGFVAGHGYDNLLFLTG